MGLSIAVPAPVQTLLQRLNGAGFAAYAVGGCVRDSLLGRAPQDWDICTAARPEETAACFSDLRTILTGARYGTVTVLYEDIPYEITTFRAEEGYSDCRHPDAVRFLPALEGDLARRDFTVNAMAADSAGRVTDCCGGLEDLRQGRVRCVGDPEQRFQEDALRILRGLRFAARFDFSIDPATGAAIHALAPLLGRVAPERLSKELTGLLCGPGAGRILGEYGDVLTLLIPELGPCRGFVQYNPHHIFDVWTHILHVLEGVPPRPVLRLAALLHDVGKPACFTMDKNLVGHFYGHAVAGAAMAEDILRRLRFDGHTVQTVTRLVRRHDRDLPRTARAMSRMLGEFGEDTVRDLLLLRAADRMGKGTEPAEAVQADLETATALLEQVLAAKTCFSLRHLAVNGRDLTALGMAPGPALGRTLQALLAAVMEERVPNEREALLELARKS